MLPIGSLVTQVKLIVERPYKKAWLPLNFHHSKMRILLALFALTSVASATVITVTASSAVAGGAAFLLGAKLLAVKGLLLGRALRKGRAVEDLSEVILEASRKDMYDCAKKLVCELNAKMEAELEVISMIFEKLLCI